MCHYAHGLKWLGQEQEMSGATLTNVLQLQTQSEKSEGLETEERKRSEWGTYGSEGECEKSKKLSQFNIIY